MAANDEKSGRLEAVEALFRSGDLKAAGDLCRDALKADPKNWQFLQLMAMTLNEAGLADQALPFLQRCLQIRGADSAVLFNYGVVLRNMYRFVQAVRAFRHAAEASPERFDCWFNLGETLSRLGRFEEAAEALCKAASIEPDNPDAWFNLGNAYLGWGDFDAAVDAFENTVARAPEGGEAINNLGLAMKAAGRMSDAIAAFRRAIDADSQAPASHDNLGNALAATGDAAGAIAAFLEALRLKPDYAGARFNLAAVYFNQRQFPAAEAELRLAVNAEPGNPETCLKLALCLQLQNDPEGARRELEVAIERLPGDAALLAQMGNVMRDLGEFDQGRDYFAQALTLQPVNPVIVGNLALANQHEGKLPEAIETYRRAKQIEDRENIRSNLARALLLGGHYREGWAEFETRLSEPAVAAMMKGLPGLPWNGEPLDGKTILLRSEQGIGDAIQFARYVKPLADAGARVLLAGAARLEALFSGLEGLAGYVDAAGALPGADYHAPLMSLPHRMGDVRIPAGGPYLKAEAKRIADWRARFDAFGGLKIGIAWQGNPDYEMDYARSLAAVRLEPLFGAVNAHFVVLQQGFGRDQIAALASHYPIIDPGELVDQDAAFVDTAAIMANLDLIITSDTAIPHLAGALGRPVWVLLPFAPDWRWMLGRDDSPWYPDMRLFRQTRPRDWPSAVAAAAACLRDWRPESSSG